MTLFASLIAPLLFSHALAGPANVPAPNVKVGDAALLFSLPAINEDAALRAVSRPHVALSDYTGVMPGFPAKVLVVHFTQKAGSDAQLQALNRLQKRYSNSGARFLAIMAGSDDLPTVSAWIESLRLEFPVLRDVYSVVVDRYGVRRFPMTMVIDAEGDIQAIGVPGDDLESSVEAIITPYLAK